MAAVHNQQGHVYWLTWPMSVDKTNRDAHTHTHAIKKRFLKPRTCRARSLEIFQTNAIRRGAGWCVCGEGVVDGVVKRGGGGGRIKKDRLRISFYQTAHNLGSHWTISAWPLSIYPLSVFTNRYFSFIHTVRQFSYYQSTADTMEQPQRHRKGSKLNQSCLNNTTEEINS